MRLVLVTAVLLAALFSVYCSGSITAEKKPPPVPGAFGAACETATDCDSGLCLQAGVGATCSRTCVDDCPPGYVCRAVVTPAPEPIMVCWPADAPSCVPVVESCNEADDDCDGEVDEDFRDADGLYHTDAHCGACGNDCATAIAHGTGSCDTSAGAPFCRVDSCNDGYIALTPFSCSLPLAISCKPCVADEDCLGGACATIGRGTYCASPCAGEEEVCAAGYICQTLDNAARGCLPLTGSCVCDAGTAGLERGCAVSNAFGLCRGAEVCDATDGWGACSAATPAAETCNGLDDDCDESIDDGLVAPGEPCVVSNVFGTCAGDWRCAGAAGWVCSAPVPAAESCNDLDDDCDGQVDEEFRDGATGAYDRDEHCGACDASCLEVFDYGTGRCQLVGDEAGCVVDSCEAGYRTLGGYWCVPALDGLCVGCVADADCPGALDRCLDLDGARVCGRDCAAGNEYGTVAGECPAGFLCQDQGGAWQCAPQSGSCTCLAANQGAGRLCSVTNPIGTCHGLEICDAASGWSSCNAPVPTLESCNGVDDDCNGSIDDGLTALLCPNQTGACAGSRRTCGGTLSWLPCGPADYGPLYEVVEVSCDGINNDCDLATDEDLPPVPCASQLGVCRGSTALCGGAAGWLACGPAQYGASYEVDETTCDGLDNDCDGAVDEGYLNAGTGKYDQDTACGNCATDCTQIYARPNAVGICDASGVPVCVMQCLADSFDLNGIAADGCELSVDDEAIYVSANDPAADDVAGCGLGPLGTGAGHFPCRSIRYGRDRAFGETRARVLVADGLYTETVALLPGIDLLGGFRPDTWERHLDTTLTVVRGDDSGLQRKTLIANGINSPTLVEGFVIEGVTNPASGGNSYALWVRDSDANLIVRGNRIYGGEGGRGVDGASAASGDDGQDGVPGQDTIETTTYHLATCLALSTTPGNQGAAGDGGSSSCGVGGGAGAGAVCPNNNDAQPTGAAGQTTAGGGAAGLGGVGGHDRYSTNCSTFMTGGYSAVGLSGTPGLDGVDGSGGAGCPVAANQGTVVAGEWSGTGGGNGGGGQSGGGGGGGGAGGGADLQLDCAASDDTLGGSGGGGGGGGCGGDNGRGGGAGGGAFAVFVTFSAPSASAPTLVGNELRPGRGGAGGAGSQGGVGGLGGGGASGGNVSGPLTFVLGVGGRGGDGGNGGHGGGGGGGCGGVAYGIFADNVLTSLDSYLTDNTFLPGSGGGAGGQGGLSLGASGTAGAVGAAGAVNF